MANGFSSLYKDPDASLFGGVIIKEILLLSDLSCCVWLKITKRVVFSFESSIFSLSKFKLYKFASVFEPIHASLCEVTLSAPSELLNTGIN